MYLCSALQGQGTSRCAERKRRSHRVHAGNKCSGGAEHVEYIAAHARHDAHADDDVGAVGQLDADVRNGTAQRPHRERHDIERAPSHATFEQLAKRQTHRRGRDPVVGRPGIVLALTANERAIFDACDIGRIGPRQVTVRPLRGVELAQRTGRYHLRAQPIVFELRAVAPFDALRPRFRCNLAHPGEQLRMTHVGRCRNRGSECGRWIRMIHAGEVDYRW